MQDISYLTLRYFIPRRLFWNKHSKIVAQGRGAVTTTAFTASLDGQEFIPPSWIKETGYAEVDGSFPQDTSRSVNAYLLRIGPQSVSPLHSFIHMT